MLDIQYNLEGDGSLTCTGSDTLKSKMTICYRTLPVTREDRRLRPDLRLADLDPGLARVASIVQWMKDIYGLGSSAL
jgi:hypothetical protein